MNRKRRMVLVGVAIGLIIVGANLKLTAIGMSIFSPAENSEQAKLFAAAVTQAYGLTA